MPFHDREEPEQRTRGEGIAVPVWRASEDDDRSMSALLALYRDWKVDSRTTSRPATEEIWVDGHGKPVDGDINDLRRFSE